MKIKRITIPVERTGIVRPNVSFVQSILGLFKVAEPTFWVLDGILFVIDFVHVLRVHRQRWRHPDYHFRASS